MPQWTAGRNAVASRPGLPQPGLAVLRGARPLDPLDPLCIEDLPEPAPVGRCGPSALAESDDVAGRAGEATGSIAGGIGDGVDRALVEPQGGAREAGQTPAQVPGAFEEDLVRLHGEDQADLPCPLGVDQLTTEDEELRPLPADGGDERAGADEAHPPFGHAEAGALAGDDQIARGNQ